jgi:hypothetical protein
LLRLFPDFLVNFILVIEIIPHGSVGFRRTQVWMLAAHFLNRPTVREVVHNNLGDANPGEPLQAGRLALGLIDVGVRK